MNTDFQKLWDHLKQKSQGFQSKTIHQLFEQSHNRVRDFSLEVCDIYVDYSKSHWDLEIKESLLKLASSAQLDTRIKNLFQCDIVNSSENRSATHHLYRADVATQNVRNQQKKIHSVASKYLNNQWLTAFGKPVKHLVNIGVGGSYLGPSLAVEALTELQQNNSVKIHFLSSIDNSLWKKILNEIDLEHTLFCLSSKSLGTSETMINWRKVQDHLQAQSNYSPGETQQSFVVATANQEKALNLGAAESHILPFDETVGGRFSVWSSIGFPLLMAIGESSFKDFLKGAAQMDDHFRSAPFEKNLPVILALLSIWNRNFLNRSSTVVAPYDFRLNQLPLWLQQLSMESNGKKSGLQTEATAPSLFGDHGQLAQHAFFQALHQGSDTLPVDFIGVNSSEPCQKELLVNMLAQSAALMNGVDDTGDSSTHCPGNRPSTTFILNGLTPNVLGQLMSMYEHMIFTQSVIWNINCFDQPGVELGKSIARTVLQSLQDDTLGSLNLDPSTHSLIDKVFHD